MGRKLWQRQYVDGNGGNISYRLGPNAVICTPTLISKADLRPQDLCLVDLEGNQLAGGKPRTSEILMHLEIYKEVPEAKAVVHCHPPHATAYAITGGCRPPASFPNSKSSSARSRSPRTKRRARRNSPAPCIPFVKTHNTILLANHGIVCWGDTVTHAEWYAEVIDTYCWTLMLAAQLGAPITHISGEKAADLLAIKKKLGLPDPRIDSPSCEICDLPTKPGQIAIAPGGGAPCATIASADLTPEEIDALVKAVTEEIVNKLK